MVHLIAGITGVVIVIVLFILAGLLIAGAEKLDKIIARATPDKVKRIGKIIQEVMGFVLLVIVIVLFILFSYAIGASLFNYLGWW